MSMQRAVSDSSTVSGSRLRRIGSAISRRISSKSAVSPTEGLSPVQKFVQELDATETATVPNGISASDHRCFEQLRGNIRSLYEASLGPQGVDVTFSIYARHREQSLNLCQVLVDNSKAPISNSPFGASKVTGTVEVKDNNNGYMNDTWLTVIHDYKAYQQLLLENLRTSIISIYEKYNPDATVQEEEDLLDDMRFRDTSITKMRHTIVPSMAMHTLVDWQYENRFSNYDILKSDLKQIEKLCVVARSKNPDIAIREYDIAVNGDTILEFAKAASEIHPVLRFRVSSHMLTEASPYFARIFKSSYSEPESPLEYLEKLPPAPIKQVCKDGTEVKVYKMPQMELNKWESLKTLLEAAHMHNDKIPREVRFNEFVSIAEVCLRYQCTGPLEMSVEYRWLPAWIHKANEDLPEGFLLISYVFGLRRLFTRSSKSIILNTVCEEDIRRNVLWPIEVKEKIRAIRETKLSQVYEACFSAVKDFIQEPAGGPISSTTTLTSTPKCPRGLHQCDATNLGWLMLIFQELGMLHIIMNGKKDNTGLLQRSINDLVGHLRTMPSAPQMHTGVCSYAPAFRSALNDVYNSIKGLTLLEVGGKPGWALSKRHDVYSQFVDDLHQGVFELPASIGRQAPDPAPIVDDAITLQILTHIDTLDDLHSSAMIGKRWYSVYKKNEVFLVRNLAKKKKSILGYVSVETSPNAQVTVDGTGSMYNRGDSVPSASALLSPLLERNRLPRPETSIEQMHGITPPRSPRSSLDSLPEVPLTPSQVEQILWGTNRKGGDPNTIRNRLSGVVHNLDPESNAKYLSSDAVLIDKSLVLEDNKHLRDEHDRNLRMGPQWI